ncbi:integrase catalytic domain-containing protein [Trichonephila clavipes]|nr:integrase catalytic domain-containing protein [Trichonephila clavipes]
MFFTNTHRRDSTGRFIVYMSVQDEELPTLGNFLFLAQKRLNQTIKNLNRDPYIHKLYCEFLEEYESFDHMQRISDNCYSPINYYLPHRGVFKTQNNSTKLRGVFDGSASATSGRSLNDILLSGRVHEDVSNIMLRVSKIQALTANYQWKPISSCDNSANLISRGVNPSDLEHLELWWSEPSSAMEKNIDDSRQKIT